MIELPIISHETFVVEEIKEQRQSIVVIDVSYGGVFKNAVLDSVSDVIDELIGIFKDARTVERYQTFASLEFPDLLIDRDGKIAGDRTDQQKIVFIKRSEKISVCRGVGSDPDQLADRDELLLEDLAGKGRVFGSYQYNIPGVHEHVDQFIESRKGSGIADILTHFGYGISKIFPVTGMVGVIDEAAFMGDDDVNAVLELGIAVIADILDETLNGTAGDEAVLRNLIYTYIFKAVKVIEEIFGDHKIRIQFIVGIEDR